MIFTKIFRFAFYRLKIIGGSLQSLLALFLLPPLIVLLTGQVMHEVVDPHDVPVAVADLDNSEYSLILRDRLADDPMLSIMETDEDTARQKVVSGKKEVAFIIEAGFMDNIRDEQLDGIITVVHSPSSLLTELLSEIIAGEVIRLTSNTIAADMVLENYLTFNIPLDKDTDKVWQEAWQYTDSQWEPAPLVQLDTSYAGTGAAKETGQSDYHHAAGNLIFMLGILTVLMMFLTISLHSWMVAEKSDGISSRLEAAAVSLNLYRAGNSLAVLAAVSVSSLFTLWLGSWFLNVAGAFSPLLLLLFFFYLLCCTALALFLATMARTTGQLQVTGILVVVLTGVFGGIFSQTGELSGHLQWLIKLMPQSWVLTGAGELLFYSKEWESVAQPIAALSLFFIIFTGLTIKVGSRND